MNARSLGAACAAFACCALLTVGGTLSAGPATPGEPDKAQPAGQGKEKKRPPAKDAKAAAKPAETGQATTPPSEAPQAEQPSVHVYTNDDLERMPPDPAWSSQPAKEKAGKEPPAREKAQEVPAKEADPLKQMEDEQARVEAQKLQIAEAEQNVANGYARVKELEQRLLEVKNPFLPRPKVPPEQAEEWNAMSVPDRVKRTEQDLAEAKKQLEDANAKLRQLRSGP